jgi:ribosome-associated protein
MSAAASSENKAEDVVILDLRGLTDACDFFVIASGNSDTQVRGIAEHVVETLERGGFGSPWHVEGMGPGRWVLLDYIDFVVHVFHHELRSYYQLERLWGDAPIVAWT